MARVLILFAHPALEKSRAHRRLIGQVPELPGLTFHDLYEAYPDFAIDVPREQALLLNHDLILFQPPFYWYSAPPILNQWADLVLEHGWAYGSQGNAVRALHQHTTRANSQSGAKCCHGDIRPHAAHLEFLWFVGEKAYAPCRVHLQVLRLRSELPIRPGEEEIIGDQLVEFIPICGKLSRANACFKGNDLRRRRANQDSRKW